MNLGCPRIAAGVRASRNTRTGCIFPQPDHPHRAVCTAGGPIDVIARVYADKLQQRWGQSVIVLLDPPVWCLVATPKQRQPWYPVQELYGLICSYMGPPDKKPVLPKYECLEMLEEGECLEANDDSIGGGGPQVIPCNWQQHYDNLVDPFHVVILHATFSGTQFVEQMAVMPEVT